MRSLRGGLAPVALALVLASAGCQDDPKPVPLGEPGASAAGSASPSAALRTTTVGALTITLPPTGDAAYEPVFAGYQAFWEGLIKALAKADPSEPAFTATTTGGARSLFANNLVNMQLVRRTQSGPVRLHPGEPSITATSATLTDCADLSELRIRNSGGKPVNPPDPKTTQVEVELVLQSGKWIVKNYDETVRGCQPA